MADPRTQSEERRLRLLAEYGVLDSPPPATLVDIVKRAAAEFGSTYAALSVVDNAYERFTATHGGHFISIPRYESFAEHVIQARVPVMVPDASRDPVYRDMMLVREPPGIRFYLGVPVSSADGQVVAVLSVMHRGARVASEQEIELLEELAERVGMELGSERFHVSQEVSARKSGKPDFAQIFDALPGSVALLDANNDEIVAVTDEFLAKSQAQREELLGRNLFDVFPADPEDPSSVEGVRALRQSLERIKATRSPDRLLAQHYPIPLRNDRDRHFLDRYWNGHGAPVLDESGNVRWIVLETEDVTEYVHAKRREGKTAADIQELRSRASEMEANVLSNAQELKRLNNRLSMAHRVANIASWEIRPEGDVSIWSDELYRLLGLRPGSVQESTETFMEYVHPDDRERVRKIRADAVHGEVPASLEHRMIRADGEIRYVQERAEVVRDSEGKPLLVYGTIQDITEHKWTEMALAARARQQAAIARLGQEALEEPNLQKLWDEAVRAVAETFDVEYCKVLELTPGAKAVKLVAGVGWQDGLVGNATVGIGMDSQAGFTLHSAEPVIVEDLRTETRFSGPSLLHNHDIISGISTIIPGENGAWGVIGAHSSRHRKFSEDDIHFLQGVAVIIAEANQRAAHVERMRESEERFRIIARATADTIWDWNLETDRVWWNEGMQAVFGYAPEEIEPDSRSFRNRIYPDDRQEVDARIESTLNDGHDAWHAEYRFYRRDGSLAEVSVRGFVIRDADGEPIRMVGAMDDITLRKEYETRLHEQAALLDRAQDAIMVHDLSGGIVYWNKGAERLYGWTRDEVQGKPPDLLYADRESYRDAFQALMESGEWMGEFRHRRKDGRDIVVESGLTLLVDEDDQPKSVLAINTDITERTTLEEQLRQSQRLESVGQLTGGVAHDFNNLLTVILGNAELMLDQLPPGERMHKLASMTRTAAQRGAELTHRLLAFARRQALEPKTFDVNRLIQETEPLLRHALPETIALEILPLENLWPAFADASQLESVILNLALNARDAMPEGGQLVIETANVRLDEEYCSHNTDVAPGRYVLVAVSDTGSGIAPEHLDLVFDPFFTTKEKGKGTGLGLSMAYGFAKQSQGHIKIYSEAGQGTTVKLYLPRSRQSNESVEVEPTPQEELRGSERILVVEDNDLVREYAARQLREFGYDVQVARNGSEALDILHEQPDIDLLFTDVIMSGGMGGRELAEEASRFRPDIKVLYTSGYTENAIVHHGRLDEGVHLLQKPYQRVDLAKKVRRALSNPPTSRPGEQQ